MRIHVVGIGGAGMSAVARLLLARGDVVTGSDTGSWPLAEALARDGATVHRSFAAAQIRDADIVLRSSAYGDANPEVRAALAAGIPVWRRHDAWSELARGKRVVAIAGTHGKTTTTALTWTALRAAGVDASLICGAVLRGLESNAYAGRDPTLVIEADEYDRTFLALAPEVAVVTNVDHDHVDVFPTKADYDAAFQQFASQVTGTLVVCADDPGASTLGAGRMVSYGTRPGATYRISGRTHDGPEQTFAVAGTSLTLRIAGAHNALNATAALAAAAQCGVAPAVAAAALGRFAGTARRLEVLGEAGGVTVVDDYAHHPAEIAAGLAAFEGRRTVVVFQPHTTSRSNAFFDDFVAVLKRAAVLVVVETFASARGTADAVSSARRLADVAGGVYARTADDAVEAAVARARADDVVLVMGAGDVRPIGLRVLARLGVARPA
ncbi:MAG TPA: UDP-N-acetylmuramate--L-alanine ligase [Candidatus Limnocylindria bacterium]|nr:UDP-N-acetylmuramate--L-alanine ligase [Candidatus Limnocylindria bacterium]